eukprot:gb/GFBE01024881.1/.p1 GENE.gb/GFBE01024881.1/~~gb/GFBE01024881.1/.p1  ORF type:complete len:386 (+),score=72.49 gb/GFBE01024881.1/:1-1158(+)
MRAVLLLMAGPALVAASWRKDCHRLLKAVEHMDEHELRIHCRVRLGSQRCDDMFTQLGSRPWSRDARQAACKNHEDVLAQNRILVDADDVPHFDADEFTERVERLAKSATTEKQKWDILNQEMNKIVGDAPREAPPSSRQQAHKRILPADSADFSASESESPLPKFDADAFVARVKARAAASPPRVGHQWDALNQEMDNILENSHVSPAEALADRAARIAKPQQIRSLDDATKEKKLPNITEVVGHVQNALTGAQANVTNTVKQYHSEAAGALKDAHATVMSGLQGAHAQVTSGLQDLKRNATEGVQKAEQHLTGVLGIADSTVQDFERVKIDDAKNRLPIQLATAMGVAGVAALVVGVGFMALSRRATSPRWLMAAPSGQAALE